MKRIARYLISGVGLVWMFTHNGCQGPTLVTTAGPSSSGLVEGMLYYLPIGKITIKGEYAEQSPTPSPAGTGTPTPSPSPTPTPTPTPPKQARASEGKPSNGGKDNDSVGGSITISGGQLKITVTSRVEADQEAGVYYVTPQTNDIFEDEIQVTVNSKHLLSAGKVTTEDKTAEIVGTIASIAVEAAGLREYAMQPLPTPTPLPFYFSFDPSNRREVDFVKRQLKQRGVGLRVSTDAVGKTLDAPTVKATARELGKTGLVFRPAVACNVELTYPIDPTNGKPPPKGKPYIIKDTEQFILPDRTKLLVMKYDRMPFVKKVREVGFSDGMLADFHQKRPSPILGFLGIPKAILQAIVPIPGAAGPSGSASASGTTASQ
jgi:Predicted solute binding protein